MKHHIIHPVEKPYIFGVIRLPYNLSYQTTTEICFTFPLEGSTTLSKRLASVDFPAPVRPTKPTFRIQIILPIVNFFVNNYADDSNDSNSDLFSSRKAEAEIAKCRG